MDYMLINCIPALGSKTGFMVKGNLLTDKKFLFLAFCLRNCD